MMGPVSQVASILGSRQESKYEFYIHCSSNNLNLVLVDKAVPEAEEFSPLEKMYMFTSGSAVHQATWSKWMCSPPPPPCLSAEVGLEVKDSDLV